MKMKMKMKKEAEEEEESFFSFFFFFFSSHSSFKSRLSFVFSISIRFSIFLFIEPNLRTHTLTHAVLRWNKKKKNSHVVTDIQSVSPTTRACFTHHLKEDTTTTNTTNATTRDTSKVEIIWSML